MLIYILLNATDIKTNLGTHFLYSEDEMGLTKD